jgi:hypothetical protein
MPNIFKLRRTKWDICFSCMNKSRILVCFLFVSFCSLAQNVFIKSGNRLVELSNLKSIKIHQYKVSGEKDSVYTLTDVDSLYRSGDTLVVRPWLTEETHYLDPNADITTQKLYKPGSNTLVKIPIIEIDKIVGKKRSLSKTLGIVSTIAFLGVGASIPLRLSNADNQNIGNTLFVIAAPTLIVSWTLQAIVAKKRFHFNKNRTDKKIWVFN